MTHLKFLSRIFINAVVCFVGTTALASRMVRDTYVAFDSVDDAFDWLKVEFPEEAARAVDKNDAVYALPRELAEKLWLEFKSLFPNRTADLPPPQILIVNATNIDGWVLGDKQGRMTTFIKLHLPAAKIGREALLGLMAHELTHMLFLDFEEKFYHTSSLEEPLGFQQTNDADAQKTFKEWVRLTGSVGAYFIPELNGLPLPFIYDGGLFDVMTFLAIQHGDPSVEACKTVSGYKPQWTLDLQRKFVSPVDLTLKMTEADRAHLNETTLKYVLDYRACLNSKKVSYIDLMVAFSEASRENVEKWYRDDAAIVDAQSDVGAGILELLRVKWEKARVLFESKNISRLRHWSGEEVADDMSVRILSKMGETPTGINGFFEAIYDSRSPTLKQECRDLIATGKTPGYGVLSDTHHSKCYRIFHVNKVAEWLRQNPNENFGLLDL